ncbi:MAG TPA: energy transducer TonB [Terriglobales bacterium]
MKTFTLRPVVLSVFVCAAISNCIADQSSDLAQRLQDRLKGKVLLLRGFYQNGNLNYTADGEVMGNPVPGAWTLAKIQIQEITVSSDAFELLGPRVAVAMDYKKGEFVNVLPAHKNSIKITVHAPAATTDAQKLEALIQKIFIEGTRLPASLVPAYWQDFFTGRITRMKGKDGRFIFQASNSDLETKTNDSAALTLSTASGVLATPMPKNTKPPRIVSQVDPDYSEVARASSISGTVLVRIQVDSAGEPRNPQIIAPIGFGLDDKAIEAIQQWRFAPAKRNGEPVPVLVNIEMNFRL